MTDIGFFYLANESYKHLDYNFAGACEIGWFNIFASECGQIVEKIMKAVLKITCVTDTIPPDAFYTYDLQRLSRILNRFYPDLINTEKAAWLTDFCFEPKCPEDECFIVTKSEAEKVLKTTKDLAEPLIELYNDLIRNKRTRFTGGNK